jgi:histidyl-tRNA synthetase
VLHELDRLGKISNEEVEQKLVAIDPDADKAKRLMEIVTQNDLAALNDFQPANANFTEGLGELQQVYTSTLALGVPASALKINLAIARGLDYYTGTVYETFLTEHPKLGSICSGGRYADLASHYTKSKLPGVGISIGATRLFSQLVELGLIKADAKGTSQVVVLNVEAALAGDYLAIAKDLRAQGINTEVYGGEDKLGKQMKYADRSGAPVAVLLGSRERDAGQVKLKLLRENREVDVSRGELVGKIRELLGV